MLAAAAVAVVKRLAWAALVVQAVVVPVVAIVLMQLQEPQTLAVAVAVVG